MVLILNGEVLQDNDPRAVAARAAQKSGSSTGGSASRAAPAAAAGPSSASRTPLQPQQQQGFRHALSGVLDPVEKALGIQGRTIRCPGFLSVPATEIPLIFIILVGVLALFFGWPVLLLALGAHFVLNSPPTGGAVPPPAAGPGAGAGHASSASGGPPPGPGGNPPPRRGVHGLH